MRRKGTEIREEDGNITINGRSWEDWTVRQLLKLIDELEDVSSGSWQLVQSAEDATTRREALDTYSADLRREIAAYRALGYLRMMLDPAPAQARSRYWAAARRAREGEEEAARSVERIEYVLGCELAGICPDGGEVPDPDGVTPREGD